ncbi:MAG: hypothetical protein H0X33_10160 [Taibaiella sp.]|nr:hypothetical protein [Taibaiella sp.]
MLINYTQPIKAQDSQDSPPYKGGVPEGRGGSLLTTDDQTQDSPIGAGGYQTSIPTPQHPTEVSATEPPQTLDTQAFYLPDPTSQPHTPPEVCGSFNPAYPTLPSGLKWISSNTVHDPATNTTRAIKIGELATFAALGYYPAIWSDREG